MGRPKRRVLAVAEETSTPPDELTDTQSVARVIRAEGNSLYLCGLPGGDKAGEVLVELAGRFRNTMWLRRGGYVLVHLAPAQERKEGSRVAGEIINVVRDERAWRKQKYWPAEFPKTADEDDEDDDSNVGKLPPTDSEPEDEGEQP